MHRHITWQRRIEFRLVAVRSIPHIGFLNTRSRRFESGVPRCQQRQRPDFIQHVAAFQSEIFATRLYYINVLTVFDERKPRRRCRSGFLRIMTPVLQTLVTLAVLVPFSFLFLCKMPLAISYNLPHMINVILVVLARVFLRILVQYGHYFAPRLVPNCFCAPVFGPTGTSRLIAA
jgi:hypothetical protein